ncbi:MAG TPA: hypothetical protein VFS43_42980 [Polyangiaceae bacterium]|nr:hypothetical protein [Polyangiaceae bacterium]
MREIYQSAHLVVTLDEEHKIVRRQRTRAGYESTYEIQVAYQALLDACEHLHRPEYMLLADLRLAPPRNDPAFEQVVSRYYDRLYGGFRKIAILVQTEAGRLQMMRLATPSVAGRMRAFTSESAALEYLLRPGSGQPPGGRGPAPRSS